MALQKETVDIPFIKGIDTKTIEELVQAPSLLQLENARMVNTGQVQKRFGYDHLSKTVAFREGRYDTANTATMDLAIGLTSYQGNLTQLSQGYGVTTFTAATNRWQDHGRAQFERLLTGGVTPPYNPPFTDVRTFDVADAGAYVDPSFTFVPKPSSFEVTILDDMALYVWTDWITSATGAYYAVREISTGHVIVAATPFKTTTTNRVKCVTVNQSFHIVTHSSTGTLELYIVDPDTPELVQAPITLTTSASAQSFDIGSFNTFLVTAYANISGGVGDVIVFYTNENGTSPSLSQTFNTAFTAIDCLSLHSSPDTIRNSVAVTGIEAGVRETYLLGTYGANGIASQVTRQLTAFSGVTHTNLTHVFDGTDIYLYAEEFNLTIPANTSITTSKADWTTASTIANSARTFFSAAAGIGFKAVYFNSDAEVSGIYVGLTHESDFQSTYYLVKDTGFGSSQAGVTAAGATNYVVAAILKDVGIGLSRATGGAKMAHVPRALFDEDGLLHVVLGKGIRAFGTDSTPEIVNSTLVHAAITIARTSIEVAKIGKSMLLAGGVVRQFDGVSMAEHGFHMYPEGITVQVVGAGSGGGFTSSDTYGFAAVYEWRDGQGNRHQSAPEFHVIGPSAEVDTADSLTISVPTLRITDKFNDIYDVDVVVYVTEPSGTIYYRKLVYSNDKTANYVTITSVDAAYFSGVSTSAEALYTTGGILENISLGAVKTLGVHGNRIFAIRADSPEQVNYSKTYVEGEGVQFYDGSVIKANETTGAFTAIQTGEDKLLLFKDSASLYVTGDGPNDAGIDGAFSEPAYISRSIGCSNQNSIAPLEGGGFIFKSNKGFYAVDRGLNMRYIGAPVEAYNTLNVTSAIDLANTREVRFTHDTDTALNYNYEFDVWSTFTNYAAAAATYHNEVYYNVTSAAQARQESSTTYKDNNVHVTMTVTTAWLSVAKLQGFQRIYMTELLGTNFTDHTFRVQYAYDFDPSSFFQAVTYATSALTSSRLQLRIKPARQKCEAIKIKIDDQDQTSTGKSFALSNLALEVGVKADLNKLRTGQTGSGA